MASIPRKTQQVFGSALAPAGNIAVWGSLKDAAPAYSSDPATIQSAEWVNGMAGALVGNRSPTVEDLNGLFLVLTQQIAYILQAGIPEYDAGTTYWKGQYVRVPGTSFIAASLTDNNTGHDPATDSNNWNLSAGRAPAAATFGGGGTQNVAVDGAGHKLLLNGPYINPDLAYSAANSRYTAPIAGNYLVTANLQVDNISAAAATIEFSLRAVKNAAVIVLARGYSVANPPGSRWYPGLAGMVALAAGDTLELQLEAGDTVNTGQVAVSNSDWSISRV